MVTIDERTKVPITIIGLAIGLALGVASWATALEFRVSNHEKIDDSRVAELKTQTESNTKTFTVIDTRLTGLEAKVDTLIKMMKDK